MGTGKRKRVFLVVLDSFGIGGAQDAEAFGDKGTNTLCAVYGSAFYHAPHLERMGLLAIDGVAEALSLSADTAYGEAVQNPHTQEAPFPLPPYTKATHTARIARLCEASAGKDTTIGHWEIAGIISEKPLPTFPNGFPASFLQALSEKTGRGVLCNRPYSGTEVIQAYGDEHIRTGKLIVYTSADSVLQIAAHEDIVPPETLYAYCREARKLLTGELGAGRVIARPFTGKSGAYVRTSGRHDFSLLPPSKTMLDILKESGRDVIAVGKINDIFAGRGVTEHIATAGNTEGIRALLACARRSFDGLCFVNLVDFDMLYGHRRDTDGYARALAEFDAALPELLSALGEDDLLLLTADHGCDPSYTKTTDHTRENVPLLMYGRGLSPDNLGTRDTFADIAATVLSHLDFSERLAGTSML